MIVITENARAFLALIRHSEGSAKHPDPWAVTFGEQFVIEDFSDHPALLGWSGFPYRGIEETAAGAYQINKPTWVDGQRFLRLPDFSRESQDAFVVGYLLPRAGAFNFVNAGQVVHAIEKCAGTWASLPGSLSGQPQAKLSDLIRVYSDAGGGFA